MSIFSGYRSPTLADLQAAVDHILAMPRTADGDPRDGERPDVDMGTSRDDEEMADRAADREWDARWPG